MQLIDRNSALWLYLAQEIRDLISDGEILVGDVDHYKGQISDFSYLVFPFSKAYEGFLKKLFLDIGMIREDEYYSDDIRIGRELNPRYIHQNGSVYKKLLVHGKGGQVLSDKLWEVWKRGRNRVFHYFPHNYRKLSYKEAMSIIQDEIAVMEATVILARP